MTKFSDYHKNTVLNLNNINVIDINELITYLDDHPEIQRLNLSKTHISSKDLKTFFHLPCVRNLIALDVSYANIDEEILQTIIKSKYLRNLNILNLSFNKIDFKNTKIIETDNLILLTHLYIGGNKVTEDTIKEICTLSNLVVLDLQSSNIGDKELQLIASSPNSEAITQLYIKGNYFTPKGIRKICNSQYLKNLEVLDLSKANIKDKQLMLLASSKNFLELKELYLEGNRLTNKSLKKFFSSKKFSKLEVLNLDGAIKTNKSLQTILQSKNFENLKILYIGNNSFTYNKNTVPLLNFENYPNLESLHIEQIGLTFDGLTSIATSEYLLSLRELYLNGNRLRTKQTINNEESWEILSKAKFINQLTILGLSNTNIKLYEIQKIIVTTRNLEELYLRGNHLGSFLLKVISECKFFTHLEVLEIGLNNIEPEGIKFLASSKYLSNLQELYLNNNNLGVRGIKLISKLQNLSNLRLISLKFNNLHPYAISYLTDNPQGSSYEVQLEPKYQYLYSILHYINNNSPQALNLNKIKDLVFKIALIDVSGNTISYILDNKKIPFLINNRDNQGNTLAHYYENFPNLQIFLFEHGLIPYREEQDKTLQEIIKDGQSVHHEKVSQEADFYTTKLISLIYPKNLELLAEQYFIKLGILEDQMTDIKLSLLSLTDTEKRSVLEGILPPNMKVPSDKEFVEIIIISAYENLQNYYLNRASDYYYLEIAYIDDNGLTQHITIPQSIGLIQGLIERMNPQLEELQELLVTLFANNPRLISQKLQLIREEFNNNQITEQQLINREYTYSLIIDLNIEQVSRIFNSVSGLDINLALIEQKQLVLARQIAIAANTYGQDASACAPGVSTQIITSVKEIDKKFFEDYHKYLELKIKSEAELSEITESNISDYVETKVTELIKYVGNYPQLKDALDDLSLCLINIDNPLEITLEQQKILAIVNHYFKAGVQVVIKKYTKSIPYFSEYKIYIKKFSENKVLQQYSLNYHADTVHDNLSNMINEWNNIKEPVAGPSCISHDKKRSINENCFPEIEFIFSYDPITNQLGLTQDTLANIELYQHTMIVMALEHPTLFGYSDHEKLLKDLQEYNIASYNLIKNTESRYFLQKQNLINNSLKNIENLDANNLKIPVITNKAKIISYKNLLFVHPKGIILVLKYSDHYLIYSPDLNYKQIIKTNNDISFLQVESFIQAFLMWKYKSSEYKLFTLSTFQPEQIIQYLDLESLHNINILPPNFDVELETFLSNIEGLTIKTITNLFVLDEKPIKINLLNKNLFKLYHNKLMIKLTAFNEIFNLEQQELNAFIQIIKSYDIPCNMNLLNEVDEDSRELLLSYYSMIIEELKIGNISIKNLVQQISWDEVAIYLSKYFHVNSDELSAMQETHTRLIQTNEINGLITPFMFFAPDIIRAINTGDMSNIKTIGGMLIIDHLANSFYEYLITTLPEAQVSFLRALPLENPMFKYMTVESIIELIIKLDKKNVSPHQHEILNHQLAEQIIGVALIVTEIYGFAVTPAWIALAVEQLLYSAHVAGEENHTNLWEGLLITLGFISPKIPTLQITQQDLLEFNLKYIQHIAQDSSFPKNAIIKIPRINCDKWERINEKDIPDDIKNYAVDNNNLFQNDEVNQKLTLEYNGFRIIKDYVKKIYFTPYSGTKNWLKQITNISWSKKTCEIYNVNTTITDRKIDGSYQSNFLSLFYNNSDWRLSSNSGYNTKGPIALYTCNKNNSNSNNYYVFFDSREGNLEIDFQPKSTTVLYIQVNKKTYPLDLIFSNYKGTCTVQDNYNKISSNYIIDCNEPFGSIVDYSIEIRIKLINSLKTQRKIVTLSNHQSDLSKFQIFTNNNSSKEIVGDIATLNTKKYLAIELINVYIDEELTLSSKYVEILGAEGVPGKNNNIFFKNTVKKFNITLTGDISVKHMGMSFNIKKIDILSKNNNSSQLIRYSGEVYQEVFTQYTLQLLDMLPILASISRTEEQILFNNGIHRFEWSRLSPFTIYQIQGVINNHPAILELYFNKDILKIFSADNILNTLEFVHYTQSTSITLPLVLTSIFKSVTVHSKIKYFPIGEEGEINQADVSYFGSGYSFVFKELYGGYRILHTFPNPNENIQINNIIYHIYNNRLCAISGVNNIINGTNLLNTAEENKKLDANICVFSSLKESKIEVIEGNILINNITLTNIPLKAKISFIKIEEIVTIPALALDSFSTSFLEPATTNNKENSEDEQKINQPNLGTTIAFDEVTPVDKNIKNEALPTAEALKANVASSSSKSSFIMIDIFIWAQKLLQSNKVLSFFDPLKAVESSQVPKSKKYINTEIAILSPTNTVYSQNCRAPEKKVDGTIMQECKYFAVTIGAPESQHGCQKATSGEIICSHIKVTSITCNIIYTEGSTGNITCGSPEHTSSPLPFYASSKIFPNEDALKAYIITEFTNPYLGSLNNDTNKLLQLTNIYNTTAHILNFSNGHPVIKTISIITCSGLAITIASFIPPLADYSPTVLQFIPSVKNYFTLIKQYLPLEEGICSNIMAALGTSAIIAMTTSSPQVQFLLATYSIFNKIKAILPKESNTKCALAGIATGIAIFTVDQLKLDSVTESVETGISNLQAVSAIYSFSNIVKKILPSISNIEKFIWLHAFDYESVEMLGIT